MRRATKFLSVLVAVVMLMQLIPLGVSAAAAASGLSWDESDPGWIFFYPDADVENYYLALYKDGELLEEIWFQPTGDEFTDGVNMDFFLYPLLTEGAGSYQFAVATVDSNDELNDDVVYSPKFNYVPAPPCAKPTEVYLDKNGVVTWKNNEPTADSFLVCYYLTYSDESYMLLDVNYAYRETINVEDYIVETYRDYIDDLYKSDPDMYPKNKAKFAVSVYPFPADRTVKEMAKSDYHISDVFPDDSSTSGGSSSDGDDQEPTSPISGECGDGVRYSLSADGTFTISGQGAMYDFDQSEPPYADYFDKITSVVVEEGVTHIGEGAFAGYDRITSVSFPSTLLSIGEAAFIDCFDLYDVDTTKCTKLEDIYNEAFARCALERFDFKNPNTNIWDGAFDGFNGTFYGYEDSSAQQFAQKHDIAFALYDGKAPLDRTTVSDEYYDGAKIAYDLGIMPHVYESPQAGITWDTLLPALVALRGAEDVAEALKDTVYFSDLEKGTYLNGCANYLYNCGIVYGQGDGTFGINTSVQHYAVIKILVDLLGYGPYAKDRGGYPIGYLVTAQSIGVNRGVQVAGESTPAVEQVAQMIANSLEIGMMEQVGWGSSGSMYEITANTLLYELGYAKVLGTLDIQDNAASIDGRAFHTDALKGEFVKYSGLNIADGEIAEHIGKDVKLYVKDNTVYTGAYYCGGEVIINDGAEETNNNVVSVRIVGYNLDMYMIGDGKDSGYKEIPDEPITYTFDKVHGKKTLTVYLSIDEAASGMSVSSSIQYNNLKTITYMVNGEVYQTKEVGVGTKISALTNPSITGYKFNGWKGFPSNMIMPDKDVVVTADVTKLTKITGVVLHNGKPLANSEISMVLGSYATRLGYTDSTGAFTVYSEPCEAMIKIDGGWTTGDNTIPVVVGKKDIDLGTINLDNTSLNALVSDSSVKYIDIPSSLITQADKDYAAQSQYNTVEVVVQAMSGGYVPEFADTFKEQYPEYTQAYGSVNVRVVKQTTGTTYGSTELTEIDDLMTIRMEIDDDLKHKSDFVVLRRHNGAVNVLTTTPNEDGEYIAIEGDYVSIYAKKFSEYTIGGKGLRFTKVYDETFDRDGIAVVEINLGQNNNYKVITVDGKPLYYSTQRKAYVGIVDNTNLGTGNAAKAYDITDGTPEAFVYGNVDCDEEYETIEEAVDSADLVALKKLIKKPDHTNDKRLICADLDGDGLCDSSDLIALKAYIGKGTIFSILK